jgi:hypothetical protein
MELTLVQHQATPATKLADNMSPPEVSVTGF